MALDPEEKLTDGAAESRKKKKGLPLIPIIIAVVVLAAIGAVVWFVVMPMFAPAAPVTGEEVKSEEQKKEEASSSLLYDPLNQPGIIQFDEPFTIPLRKREGVLESTSYLRVNVSLEVADTDTQDKMVGDAVVMSRLKDTIISYFSGQYAQSVQVTNWPQLKQGLMDAINVQFQKDYHVKRINFQNYLIQPGNR